MKTKDVLIGTWTGGADDGSGLRTMVYNYGVTFHENGKGISFSWERTKGSVQEEKTKIEWESLGENKIRIRYLNEKAEDWETLEYEISDFMGAYNSKHFKLVEKGKATFWEFPEPVYKSRVDSSGGGFFSDLWKWIWD